MKFFDSHAHCDDLRFEEEYEGGTHGVINDCLKDNVSYIINIGTSIEGSKKSVELAEKYENVYATCGIHPSEVYDEDVETAILKLEDLLKHEKVVALGEIGLDYHYEDIPKDIQMIFFQRQMELAKKMNIPVVIHDRDAHGDCINMIRRFPEVKGVFHCFSGSAEMAKELISLGWYISFSGSVTFKNAIKPKEACAVVPDNMLLIETDSPYLAPTPLRGKLNRPSYVELTAKEVAMIRGTTPERIAELTEENAKRLFRIK